jgi:very-short-patch-repair endonuclease
MANERALLATAASQHAVFSLAQARAAGFSGRQIERRLASGGWVRVHECAYAVGGVSLSWRGRLIAACFAGGVRAVASHASAAALWGLPGGREDRSEITCPRWRRARHDDVLVHEIKALPPGDVRIVDGIPATCAELTLLHLGAIGSFTLVELALERALRDELVSVESCARLLRRYARQGRAGVRTLRTLLDARDPARRPTESEMETRLIQTIRHLGLPVPEVQYEVRRPDGSFEARLDAAYPSRRVGIEYQSLQHHSTELERRRDRARVHRLRALGWEIIEVGPDDLQQGRHRLGEAIAAALRRAG